MDQRLIMLVEDNPDDIDLTLQAFQKNQISNQVVVARDGAEALDYFFGKQGAPRPLPVIILLDLKLPKIDGLKVLGQLRRSPRTKHLPVIILTSSAVDTDLMESYRLGANSYIRKPVDFLEFIKMVRELSNYWLNLNQPPPLEKE